MNVRNENVWASCLTLCRGQGVKGILYWESIDQGLPV